MKKKIILSISFVAIFVLGFFTSTVITNNTQKKSGYSPNPNYEYLVGAAAWQMSGEAHALMMQGFNIAKSNIEDMILEANFNFFSREGYHWSLTDGEKKLCYEGKPVAIVCDIDDTLVDGVHYTANILGKDGEWTNKSFTDFIQSAGCTALPGSVDFANYCIDNGITLFYVTNRYDQGYKTSQSQYKGQEGYKAKDGTVIGSSTYDLFGKTMYTITMENLQKLGFPTNDKNSKNYSKNAILIVNDTKLKGSNKEPIRETISNGGILPSGQRTSESNLYNEAYSLENHYIALLLGDDLNDISAIFSDKNLSAKDRIAKTIEYKKEWGTKWIVFPNAVYGSSINYALKEGIGELFNQFDYTNPETTSWNIYK